MFCLFISSYSLSFLTIFLAGGSGSRLFKYIQTIQALLGSPIMAVFLLGILWPRANTAGGLGGKDA